MNIVIVMVMTGLDITVVASALPEITTKFNSHDNYTTIIIAYLIGNTPLQPSNALYNFKSSFNLYIILSFNLY